MQVLGIRVEKLRTVDMLLQDPWSIELELHGNTVPVLVVNPVAYLLQKLLILGGRSPSKQAKDMLYIYDTLAMFRNRFADLCELGAPLVQGLSPKQGREIRRSVQTHFAERHPGVLEAAVIAKAQRKRAPEGAAIALACEVGLRNVLSGAWLEG